MCAVLVQPPNTTHYTASEKHDIVFWCGDLNYRLVCHRVLVESAINSKQLPLLLQADQLVQEMKKGAVFDGFVEGPITFTPTYKFNPGTNVYDTSAKQRTPSWTDRVLWRCNGALPANAVQLHTYTSLPAMMVSDHKYVKRVGGSGGVCGRVMRLWVYCAECGKETRGERAFIYTHTHTRQHHHIGLLWRSLQSHYANQTCPLVDMAVRCLARCCGPHGGVGAAAGCGQRWLTEVNVVRLTHVEQIRTVS